MFNEVSDSRAITISMLPFPFTWAKSRTRLSRALAIRGVPLERLEISIAASSSMGTFSIRADRLMIRASVSGS